MVADTALQPPSTPGGTAADSPHPTSDIAHPTFRAPLPPHQAALLANLIHRNLDLHATSEALSIDLASLIDFVDRPEVQERIDTYQRFKLASINDRILSATADARIAAIQDLHELNKASENPVEKRRAADLILRYSTPIPYKSASATWRPPSPPSRRTPRASDLSNLKFQISNSPPPPTPTPPHFQSPAHLRQHLSQIFHAHDVTRPASETKTLQAIHACCAPTARVHGRPIPTDPILFAQTLDPAIKPYLLGHVVQFMVRRLYEDDHTAESLIVLYHRTTDGVDTIKFLLALAHNPEANTWQITSIDLPPPDSS